MWASMTAGFDRLPYALKLLFLNIEIEHDSVYLLLRHDFGDAQIAFESVAKRYEAQTHPAVLSHHATGRPTLFVGNAYVKRVHGYTAEIGELIIKIANELPKIPELQVRHQWKKGDVAIWDNFGTVHYGVTADVGEQTRRLHRVAAWSEAVTPSLDRVNVMRSILGSQD